MTTALYISLWAYLFCMPLSEPGQVFGWLKNWLYFLTLRIGGTEEYKGRKRIIPEWLYQALIVCPKCHAGQVALWWQVFCFCKTGEFSLPFILTAIAGAYALQTWHLIIEKHLNY